MSILNRFLVKKSTSNLAKVVDSITPTVQPTATQTGVLLKGEKHFDIFEDGNGMFRAQHKSGKWLYDVDNLFGSYENASKYHTLERCQEVAMNYIKGRMTTKVGTIEFIPTAKHKPLERKPFV